ncbi:hypothetical protein FRB99_000883 [Tulasnella sp. 403]|nr:hypothetical protein FRB99_000883 [Tulasnella sp. 403]
MTLQQRDYPVERQPSTLSYIPPDIKPSPHTKSVINFFRRYKPLGARLSSDSEDATPHSRLRNVNCSQKNGWKFEGMISTEDAWKMFDQMHNDFISPHYVQDDLVKVVYSGHPLDCPHDIRSRPFRVEWATETHKPPNAYKEKPHPVFRVTYYCDGGHDPPEEANSSKQESKAGQELDTTDMKRSDDKGSSDDGGSEVGGAKRKFGPKRGRCPQHVKLVVEVMSDDLGSVSTKTLCS